MHYKAYTALTSLVDINDAISAKVAFQNREFIIYLQEIYNPYNYL